MTTESTPSSPRVSVVMCVVDPDPVFFPAAVRSILEQTMADLELIVVEEPSSASAGELLKQFTDARLRHDLHPRRTSLTKQRNRGLELARAPLVAVLDSDDVAMPERLAHQLAYMDAHPEVGVLGSQLLLIDPSSAPIGHRRYPTEAPQVALALREFNPIAQPGVIFRKDLVQSLGGYKEGIIEDYELWIRVAQAGFGIANLDEPLTHYRIHPNSTKATKLRETLRATIDLKRKYFAGQLGARARLRLAAEELLLLLPPKLVLKLFVLLTVRARSARA